jgi:hypothetical protein
MHPTLQHQLMNARITELHRQAQRDRAAQAIIRSRRAQTRRRASLMLRRAVTITSRVLTLGHGRSPSPSR